MEETSGCDEHRPKCTPSVRLAALQYEREYNELGPRRLLQWMQIAQRRFHAMEIVLMPIRTRLQG